MSKRKIGEVCFEIHGDFFTDHCRNLVREGNWRFAVKSLKEGLIGISSDQCFDILSGKKKLVGVNNLDYVDDDKNLDEQWIGEHYFTYFRNIFWYNKKYYKPYGYVNNLNAEDLTIAMKKLRLNSLPIACGFSGDESEVIDINCERAETYKKNGSDFVFYSESMNKWVLCETCENFDYPIWISQDEAKSMSREGLNSDHCLDGEALEYIDSMRFKAKSFREARSGIVKGKTVLDKYIEDQSKAEEFYSNPSVNKKKIAEQANRIGGWLTLENKKTGAKYRIPKNPFFRWCLSESSIYGSIEWKCISPRGVKMGGDDPNHTDWYLFTSLPMSICHDHQNKETAFFYEMRHKYMEELSGANLVALSNIKKHKGFKQAFVRHVATPEDISFINDSDVVIIPSASPEFEAVAHKCAKNNCVLISETGGKLCHLATVGREFGLALFMLPDAMKKFTMGSSVKVDCQKATITALELDIEILLPLKISGIRYD